MTGQCRHCGRTRYMEARRLCHRCYKDPAIRPLYRPKGGPDGGGMRGIGLGNIQSLPLPESPTDARPGSEAKIAVLAARAAAGRRLWHPRDNH